MFVVSSDTNAAIIGILIVITLNTPKLGIHVSNIETQIDDIESHSKSFASALYAGQLTMKFPNGVQLVGSERNNPVYIKNA